MSSTRRAVVVLWLFVALCTATAHGSPWSNQVAYSTEITLTYPTLIGSEAANALLADREEALAFAEETLGGQLIRRLLITIKPTLLTSWGLTEPTDGGGAIAFHVPVFALERFETDGTSPFDFAGCHEEVHAVANHLWEANQFGTLPALSEGVATYVEELRRGTKLHHAVAGALQATGLLYDVDLLLGGCPLDENAALMQLNYYYAAASLVEFLIEEDGLTAFSELYGVEWVQWDPRHPDKEPVEADPAGEVLRIYGRTVGEIDTDWKTWISAHWEGSTSEAEVFVEAFTSDLRVLDGLVPELEEYWASYPYRLIGPSTEAASRYESLTDSVYALAHLRGDPLEAAYDEFRESLDQLHAMLTGWLEAIHAYEGALELETSEGDSARLVGLLETAEADYRLAGDVFMAERAAEWLTELHEEATD